MTKKWKMGYKLVSTEYGKMLSLTLSKLNASEYKIGKITRPKKGWGPIALFDTKENVEEFCNIYGWRTIYVKLLTVKYIPSRLKFLRKIGAYKAIHIYNNVPKGTLFAREVKPIKIERR